MTDISMDRIEGWSSKLYELGVEYGTRLLGAIAILLIGLFVIKMITKGLKKFMDARNWDPSLESFLVSLSSALLKVMLVLSVLGTMGVEMTSFVAIIGAAGLAVGMALSGMLQNFAGGVMILLNKPFKVGDVIEFGGNIAKVHQIQIFHTVLLTGDNKVIVQPNGPIATGALINHTAMPKRRADWDITIAYGDDVDLAYQTIKELIDAETRILKDPEPFMAVTNLGDSAVVITVRCWVEAGDLWPVKHLMNENVYKKFAQVGLNIPFPQMDVHVHNTK